MCSTCCDRGVLEKVGVEPQIQRIGKYKSAGDQLNRESMSEAQREVGLTFIVLLVDALCCALV
jgi:hypothetical protein